MSKRIKINKLKYKIRKSYKIHEIKSKLDEMDIAKVFKLYIEDTITLYRNYSERCDILKLRKRRNDIKISIEDSPKTVIKEIFKSMMMNLKKIFGEDDYMIVNLNFVIDDSNRGEFQNVLVNILDELYIEFKEKHKCVDNIRFIVNIHYSYFDNNANVIVMKFETRCGKNWKINMNPHDLYFHNLKSFDSFYRSSRHLKHHNKVNGYFNIVLDNHNNDVNKVISIDNYTTRFFKIMNCNTIESQTINAATIFGCFEYSAKLLLYNVNIVEKCSIKLLFAKKSLDMKLVVNNYLKRPNYFNELDWNESENDDYDSEDDCKDDC